jgi:hypothetical protein
MSLNDKEGMVMSYFLKIYFNIWGYLCISDEFMKLIGFLSCLSILQLSNIELSREFQTTKQNVKAFN